MKLTRILSLVLAGILLVCALGSCGVAAPIIHVTLIIEDPNDPELPILNTEVELQTENPMVLDAFQEGCIVNEIAYTLTQDGSSVKDIKDYADCTKNGLTYYWFYLINDVEPLSGKANANPINDGDKITYQYMEFDPLAAK